MRLLDVGCGWGGMALHAARAPRRAGGGRHHLAPAGRAGREAGGRGRAVDAGRDPPAGLPRRRPTARSTPSARSACSSTWARPASASTSAGCARCCGRRAACSTTASAARRASGPACPRAASSTATCSPTASCTRSAGWCRWCRTAGFEARHLETLREHYALTLRRWVGNLEAHWDEAVDEVGEARARVWRLYMAGSAMNFEAGRTPGPPGARHAGHRRRAIGRCPCGPSSSDRPRPAARPSGELAGDRAGVVVDAGAGQAVSVEAEDHSRCGSGTAGRSPRSRGPSPRCVPDIHISDTTASSPWWTSMTSKRRSGK